MCDDNASVPRVLREKIELGRYCRNERPSSAVLAKYGTLRRILSWTCSTSSAPAGCP